MPRAFRIIPALGAVLFALVGLSACGGIPGDAVVSVDGKSITKDDVQPLDERGGRLERGGARRQAGRSRTRRTTRRASPTRKRRRRNRRKARRRRPKPQLKTQCEQQYKSLQQEVLGFLISSDGCSAKRSSLGVKVSDKEVKKQFEKIKSQQFPKAAEFEKFLKTSGQTVSDLLLRVKLNLLSLENPAEDRQTEVESHARRRSPSTTKKTRNASASPKSATC